MSNNDYILNLLNIKDHNIHILNNITEKVIKGKNTKIIEGILSYIPDYCPCCDIKNFSNNDIIKWDLERIAKLKFLKYLTAILSFFFINKDFSVNIVITLSLPQQMLLIKTKTFQTTLNYKSV
jgi:hypothetical protein